jgi:hypothetical protein
MKRKDQLQHINIVGTIVLRWFVGGGGRDLEGLVELNWLTMGTKGRILLVRY